MLQQREAIIRLLRDDDTHTVNLVKTQLVTQGRESIADLLDLLSVDDARAAQHVHDVLGQIDAHEAFEELTALCRDFPDHGELDALEYAAFLLARALSPGIDVEKARLQLDAWGLALAQRLQAADTSEERVKLLGDFFGRELGFRGNTDEYYNARNSLLPAVIESRIGIPITLSLVYLFTGARAGIHIEGVSFPGHFLIKHDGILLDSFERGRVLTQSDCAEILIRQHLVSAPAHFASAPARMILRRMLANLLYIYQTRDKQLAGTLTGWIHDLES